MSRNIEFIEYILECTGLSNLNLREIKETSGHVKILHDRFIGSEQKKGSRKEIQRTRNYGNHRQLMEAYSAYYMIVNLSKVTAVLEAYCLEPGKTKKIIDFGTGPGTALLGVLQWMAGKSWLGPVDITGLDRSRNFINHARYLVNCCRKKYGIRGDSLFRQVDFSGFDYHCDRPADLVIVMNLLAELPDQAITRILDRISSDMLNPEGCLLLIEPGSKPFSRTAIRCRNYLLTRGFCILGPCSEDVPCPADSDPDDWCHHRLKWEPPELIRQIDRETGFNKNLLNFTYFLMHKSNGSFSRRTVGKDRAWRAVSDLMPSKGKWEIFLCGGSVKKRAVLLKKNLTDSNRPLIELNRYDRIVLNKVDTGAMELIIGPETEVRRLHSEMEIG